MKKRLKCLDGPAKGRLIYVDIDLKTGDQVRVPMVSRIKYDETFTSEGETGTMSYRIGEVLGLNPNFGIRYLYFGSPDDALEEWLT